MKLQFKAISIVYDTLLPISAWVVVYRELYNIWWTADDYKKFKKKII